MKIKDFNAKVRIGSTVYVGNRPLKVEDIDRRTHEALLRFLGWVRCSEFGLRPGDNPDLLDKCSYKDRYVRAILPDGERLEFPTLRKAGESLGISVSRIRTLCTDGGETKHGIRFEYVYLEDAAKLGTS